MPSSNDIRITIRIKQEEYALLSAKAGDRPISTFVRETALMDESVKRRAMRPRPIEDHRSLAKILALLGGSDLVLNFRDAARNLDNGGYHSDDETKELVVETHKRIGEIHDLLMHALGVSKK
ncbi:MAG: hypothetical protein AAGA74_16260 [Pseudomonadota bacterium]